MSAITERPKNLTYVRVKPKNAQRALLGPDLNIVLQAIMFDLFKAYGWVHPLGHEKAGQPNINKAAKALGIPQRTLADMMDEKHVLNRVELELERVRREASGEEFVEKSQKGIGLDTLSRICAALKMDAPIFLQRHERFNPAIQEGTLSLEDVAAYDRARVVFTPEQARILGRIGEVLNSKGPGTLDRWLHQHVELLGIKMHHSAPAPSAVPIPKNPERKRR